MAAGLLGQQGEVTGFLILAVKGEVTIRGLGRDGLPINRWRGYISFAKASSGQALEGCSTGPKEGLLSMLLLLKGLLFQISHGFLMLPLQFRGSRYIGSFSLPDASCLGDFHLTSGS